MSEADLSKQIKREYNLKRANAALERRNKNLVTENKKLIGIVQMLKAQLKAEKTKLDEIISYMPKVPTEPYEKRLAKEITRLRTALEKIADRDAHGVMVTIAREALVGSEEV